MKKNPVFRGDKKGSVLKDNQVNFSLDFIKSVKTCPDCGDEILTRRFERHMKEVHPGREFLVIPFSLNSRFPSSSFPPPGFESRRAFKRQRLAEKKALKVSRRQGEG